MASNRQIYHKLVRRLAISSGDWVLTQPSCNYIIIHVYMACGYKPELYHNLKTDPPPWVVCLVVHKIFLVHGPNVIYVFQPETSDLFIHIGPSVLKKFSTIPRSHLFHILKPKVLPFSL